MQGSKPIIGLCGGIGSGKSAVAREFERLGGLLIDSDQLNSQVLCRTDVIGELREWWGADVVAADGAVDRSAIARIIFGDAREKQRLESLLHPLIAASRDDRILRSARDPNVRAVILDSPLLLESNLDRSCDAVVFVEASDAQRMRRLRETRGWDLDELRRRERWQAPLAQKKSRADYVVDNEGTIDQLRSQVRSVFERILTEHTPTDT